MPLLVECTGCGKQYNADESMAGRKIKCRQCGAVVSIPALVDDAIEPDLSPDFPSEVTDEPDLSRAGETSVFESGGSSMSAAEYDEGGEEDDSGAEYSGRRNVRLKYAYANVVDRWLPTILVVIGGLWTSWVALQTDDTMPTWVRVCRLALLALLYVSLIFPLGLRGIRMAGKDLGFQMPRTDRWRAFASLMPVFTLGSVLWMTGGGSMATMIVGLVVGFIIACGPLWLLFRLNPNEVPITAGYAGGFVVLSLAISVGILFGVNALLSSVLVSLHKADRIPGSPIAYALSWPTPPAPASNTGSAQPAKSGTSSVATANKPAVTPTAKPSVTPSGSTVAQPTPIPPVASRDSVPPPSQIPGAGIGSSAVPSIAQPTSPRPQPIAPAVPRPSPNLPPNDASALTGPRSPFVDSMAVVTLPGRVDQVVFPQTPSPWIAMLRKSNNRGDISRYWTGSGDAAMSAALPDGSAILKPWATQGIAPYLRDPQASETYSMSPDGTLLARVSSFPSLSVPIYSYAERRIVTTLKLTETDGQAKLFGFIGNERLMIHRTLNGSDGFEIWDTQADRRIRTFRTPHFMENGEPLAVSPDGSMLAVAARDTGVNGTEGQATIFMYDLNSAGQRKLPITDLDQHWIVAPTGIAISPDSSRIAVLFEQNGNGLLIIYRTKNSIKPSLSQTFFPMPVQRPAAFTKSSIIWLGEDALLMYGQSIIQASDGSNLGSLNIGSEVISQRFAKPDTCELGLSCAQDQSQFAIVRLSAGAFPSPAAK